MKRTGGAAGSPRSTTLTVSPVCNRGKLTRYAGSLPGNISPGRSGSRRFGIVIPSNQFNFSAEQFTYEADPKRDVGPFGLGASCIIEGKGRPCPRIYGGWAIRPFVRMPDTTAVAIVDKALVQFHPAVVASKEIQTGHRFQPEQRERHISFNRIPMGQDVSHYEMRLRDHFLAEELHRILPRKRLGDPV